MSLRLLVDEDTQARPLVNLLRQAGHDVLTIQEASRNGATDAQVLALARSENRCLLTHNCDDFRALHQNDSQHPGILAVYREHDVSKNMSRAEIVQAIANVEASGWEFSGQFVVLNAWNY